MFETYAAKSTSIRSASVLLDDIRELYRRAKETQAKLALYQAATDPAFNAAINALFTTSERSDLGTLLTNVNALITDFESNHRQAIGI